MFTGIVDHVGAVVALRAVPFGAELTIDASGWSYVPGAGASIAVDGCCLTAVGGGAGPLRFDLVRQTLDVTTLGGLAPGDRVNLEAAVTPETRLGGHVVQGHVDGAARVVDVRRDETQHRLRLEPPPALMDYIVERGSIAVAGVSLTIAAAADDTFDVALIPTTLARTTLGAARPGARLNIETDIVARVVVGWMKRERDRA